MASIYVKVQVLWVAKEKEQKVNLYTAIFSGFPLALNDYIALKEKERCELHVFFTLNLFILKQ